MSNENSPIGGQQSTPVQIQKATLSSSRTPVQVDITSILMEIQMFESLARPYITGYITLSDSERLIENFDIQGAEEIEIIFKRATEKSSSRSIKQNWIIQSLEKQHQTSEITNVVTLKVVDKEYFHSSLQNVNKCLQGQPWEIINEILHCFWRGFG